MPAQEEPDYYRILGVSREASLGDIKQAYHRLAARFHPDAHPDDVDAEACLRSLNQAYALLKDPAQRARYDRWGVWGPPVWRAPDTASPRAWLVAAIDHLLTVQHHLNARKPQRGQDLRYTLRLTPQECRRGCERRLSLPLQQWCPQCLGGRTANGAPPVICQHCHGAGEVRRSRWLLSAVCRCDRCHGRGVVILYPCLRCTGTGTVQVTRILTIDIPSGVTNGARLRIRGEGRAGRWGGTPGDLYVDVRHDVRRSSPPLSC